MTNSDLHASLTANQGLQSGVSIGTPAVSASAYQGFTATGGNLTSGSGYNVSLFNGALGGGQADTSHIGRSGMGESHTEYSNIGGLAASQSEGYNLTGGGFTSQEAINYSIGGETIYGAQGNLNIGSGGISMSESYNCCGEQCGYNCTCCDPGCFNDILNFFGSAGNAVGHVAEQAANGAGDVMQAGAGAIGNVVGNVGEDFVDTTVSLGGNAVSMFGGVVNAAGHVARTVDFGAVDFGSVVEAGKTVAEVGVQVLEAVGNALK
jgi:hypothetical protein